MRKTLFILSLALLIGFIGCKKDPSQDAVDRPFITTPYELNQLSTLPPLNLPSDNPLTQEGVQLGRMLFYDPILSADSTQSCASCHNQALAFTDNGKALSIGVRGLEGTRNSMPLFNLAYHLDGFFWDGRADILRHQALIPIEDPLEMDETIGNVISKLNAHPVYSAEFKKAFNTTNISEDEIGLALEQFMLTLISGQSKYDIGTKQAFSNFTPSEFRGFQSFGAEAVPNDPSNTGADCFHCHGAPLFMTRGFMNNGLDESFTDLGRGAVTGNSFDDGTFKVPSLRNIELTAPYMHDGRFKTLDEVLDFYTVGVHGNSPNLNANLHNLKDSVYLSPQTRADLIAFMKTLTDPYFIGNEEYSNPFK